MRIVFTDSAKDEISALILELIKLEDGFKLKDIAIIIYLQKASYGPLIYGG